MRGSVITRLEGIQSQKIMADIDTRAQGVSDVFWVPRACCSDIDAEKVWMGAFQS
jgi:hypothetical protein